MMLTFKVDGLDCANCASQAESAVKKINFVKDASLSYATGILQVQIDDESTISTNDIFEVVAKKIKSCDSNFVLTKTLENKEKKLKTTKRILSTYNLIFFSGVILFIIAVIFKSSIFWVELVQFLIPYFLIGHKIIIKCFKNLLKGKIFDENLLMVLATVGAFILREYVESVAVILFFDMGERFQNFAVKKSVSRIKDMLGNIPERVSKIVNNQTVEVDASSICVGDIILIKKGEAVVADCVVERGATSFDTSSLTGESVPFDAIEGDSVLSGSINLGVAVRAKVTSEVTQSMSTKIQNLLDTATAKKSSSEQFITKFAKVYTPIVVLFAIAILLIPLSFGQTIYANFRTSLMFLLISCPCALVISIPMSYFAGLGSCSRMGAFFKGSNYLSEMHTAKTFIFDKTGTLTTSFPTVNDVVPCADMSQEQILQYVAYGECQSSHPLAVAIVQSYDNNIELEKVSEHQEIAGNGIKYVFDKKSQVLVGKAKFLNDNGIVCNDDEVFTTVHLAVDGKHQGYITLTAQIKHDAKQALEQLRDCGVEDIIMLSGDNKKVAQKVADELNIKTVYAEVLPNEKLEIVEKIREERDHKIAYIGDGINDMLAVTMADIGVSCGSSADVVMENADLVLSGGSLKPLVFAKKTAAKTKTIVIQNIVFALITKIAVVAISFFVQLPLIVAVLSDVGCALIAVMNSLRILHIKGKNSKKSNIYNKNNDKHQYANCNCGHDHSQTKATTCDELKENNKERQKHANGNYGCEQDCLHSDATSCVENKQQSDKTNPLDENENVCNCGHNH